MFKISLLFSVRLSPLPSSSPPPIAICSVLFCFGSSGVRGAMQDWQLRVFDPSLYHHPPPSHKRFSLTSILTSCIPTRKIEKRTIWPSTCFASRLPRASFITLSALHEGKPRRLLHSTRGSSKSYVKPQLLLPATDMTNFSQILMPTNTSREEEFGSLYVVRLLTSKANASGLSDFHGGILVALIGQNGVAIMERILAIEHSKIVEESTHLAYNHLRFQTGSVDTAKFYGPDVGQLAALWIAPESGTWRLDEAIITVLPCAEQARKSRLSSEDFKSSSLTRICEPNLNRLNFEEHVAQTEKVTFQYVFKGHERLLGDKTDYPAAELIPSSISEILVGEASSENVLEMCQKEPQISEDSLEQKQIGLQEYMDLKVALITCTVSLVALGTACIAATGADELAKGFSLGGTGGIIYLFLLQKVVDGLPSAVSSGKTSETAVITSAESWSKSILATPLVRLALVTSTVIVLRSLLHGDLMVYFHPQEILAGVAGFFTSKVAIFLVGFSSVHGNRKNVNASNKDHYGK